jgi:hypothetical protein
MTGICRLISELSRERRPNIENCLSKSPDIPLMALWIADQADIQGGEIRRSTRSNCL